MAENIYALLQHAWDVAKSGGANIFGVEIAIVTNVQDPEKQGRVKICFPRLPGKPESDWARVCQAGAGPGRGFYWLPEVNDEVLVAFERGQASRPYVIGALWNGKDKPMKDAYTDENTTRMIQTKSGHQIVLNDKDGEEKISIADKSGKRTLTFDVKEKKFLVEAKEGDVEIHAKKKLVLQCDDLEIKTKKTGKIDIGSTFDLKVAQKASFKAGPKMELKADKVNLNPPSLDLAGLAAKALAAARAVAASAAAAAQARGEQQGGTGGAAGAAGAPTAAPGGGGDQSSDVAGPGAGEPGAGGSSGAASTTSAETAGGAPGAAAAGGAAAAAAETPIARSEIAVQLFNVAGAAQKDVEVEFSLPGGEKRAGKTGPDGSFKVDNVSQQGNARLEVPDVQVGAAGPASVAGRVRYAAGGIDVAIGKQTAVELPPRVRRCRLSGLNFETNKTFLLPAAMTGIRQLVRLYTSFEGIVGLVNGHSDKQPPKAGDPAEFNRKLSVERAEAIAAYLTDDAKAWQKFYGGTGASGKWGVREDQMMLATVKDDGGAPFYDGAIDGNAGPQTQKAMKAFQRSRLIDETGTANAETRLELTRAYMKLDGTSLPKGSALEIHGCGQTHPLPETEGDSNPDQPKNRRVEAYLFEGKVDPAPVTPCPRQGCQEHAKWVAQMVLDVDLDQPPGTLKVRVVDGKGQPVTAAHVHASGPLPLDADGPEQSFADLIPGSYKVIASAPNLLAADQTVPVPAGGSAEAVLTLKDELFDFDVLVENEAKQPLPDAQVTINAPGIAATKTNKDGLARFSKVPRGNFRLTATHPGFKTGTVDTPVPPAKPVTAAGAPGTTAPGSSSDAVPIQLTGATSDVTVTVRSGSDKGPVVPGATVSLQPASGGAPLEKPTDGSGIANFPTVPAGKVLISVQAKGFDPANPEEVVVQGGVASGKTIVLQAAPATLVVKVVEAGAAPPALPAPIGGATVRVLPPGGGAEQTAKTKGKSDKAAGEARFEKLPAGAATIRVQADGFALGNSQATLTAGATASVEVALKAASGTIVAVVTDDIGAAVDDKDVLITLQPPGSAKARTAPTTGGKARFEGVPVGQSKIIAAKPGFADGEATADVTLDQTVEKPVQLKRQFGQLTVTVTTPTGELVKDVVVVLERGKDHREAKTAASGEAPFKDVPIGKWKLSARLDNFTAPAPEEVEIKQGAGQTKTITLTPSAVVPEIVPASAVVVVKKNGCSPNRTEVKLRLKSGSLTGSATGRFTFSNASLKFFNEAGDPVTNTSKNVFSATDLNNGVKVFAEGVTANASIDAKDLTELKLELSIAGNALVAPVTSKLTVIELTLELFQSRTSRSDPAVMVANAKTDRGRFVHLQDPSFQHGRAWLVVREVRPAAFTQDLELKVAPPASGVTTGAVRLVDREVHALAETLVGLPHTVTRAQLAAAPQVAGSRGLAFFVEGATASNRVRDVQLQLGIRGGEADGDRAAFTVVRFTNFQATIPSTQALTNRTPNGFANTPVQATLVRRATAAAIAASDFDESYVNNVPIVMIENSLSGGTPVQLQVTVQPASTPVSWSRLRDTRPPAAPEGGGDTNDVINPTPAPANPRPTLTPTAGTPTLASATLLPDSVGSFRVRAFVDENKSGDFDRDPATADSFPAEPYIVMNLVLVRAHGVNNLSRANSGANLTLASAAGGPPTGNANVISTTGNMTTGPNAGVWARAVVNVLGGGSDGLRGLDRVFSNWIQDLVPTPGSTAPGGNTLDWGADYQLTVNPPIGPPTIEIHHQLLLAAQEPQGTFLPPPAAQPHRLPFPMLDATPVANAGMGGGFTAGMGGPGPNAINKLPIPAVGGVTPKGQQWTVEMWDPPGIGGFPSRHPHPPFAAAPMIAYRMNVDFRHDLCFWTNNQPAAGVLGNPTVANVATAISGPGVGPPDAACCLFASVYTNTWNVRLSLTFAATAPFAATVVTPFATSLTPDPAASRIARPLANLEVRFPPAVNRLSFDATT